MPPIAGRGPRPVLGFRSALRARIRTRDVPSSVGAIDSVAVAVSSLLSRPPDEALAVASQVLHAEARLRRLAARCRSGRGPSSFVTLAARIPSEPLLEHEEQSTPYLLALPFTVDAVSLLARLDLTTRRVVRVEKTPLVEPILGALAEQSNGRMELQSPGDLVRANRLRGGRPGERTIFVTFPDHHWTGEETSRRIRFFGEDHWFPVLEPLLFVRGVAPLVTLEPVEGPGPHRFVPVAYDRAVPRGPVTEGDAQETLAWLACRLEAVLRADPGAAFSWGPAASRSERATAARRALDRNLVSGFLRAWRAADRTLAPEAIAKSLSELERLFPNEPARRGRVV